MIDFKNIFNKSKRAFWIVLPLLIIMAVSPFLGGMVWSVQNGWIIFAYEVVCLLIAVTLYDAKKFLWAARGIALLVFILYAWYLADQIIVGVHSNFANFSDGSPSSATLNNARLGFFAYGLPCLGFALFGNFKSRNKTKDDR